MCVCVSVDEKRVNERELLRTCSCSFWNGEWCQLTVAMNADTLTKETISSLLVGLLSAKFF